MPDIICKVPCKAVDEKLESIWRGIKDVSDSVKEKISLTIFIWTTLCIIGLVGYMAAKFSSIEASIVEVKVSTAKIETQLELMNGKGKGDQR